MTHWNPNYKVWDTNGLFVFLLSFIRDLGKEYRFFCRPIGSQTRRCIVQDKNGKYDLDYQIVLTQNSKGDLDPTSIKKRFLRQS